MPSEKAPETQLAENIAGIIGGALLGTYRPEGAYGRDEHGIFIDQTTPVLIDRYTLITPLATTSEGRAGRLFRVQLAHRLTAADDIPAIDVARAHAEAVAGLFDHRPTTPAILGISWAEEYSRTVFDPDTQDRVTVTQSIWFRGRRS
jgi:hypothetical protein